MVQGGGGLGPGLAVSATPRDRESRASPGTPASRYLRAASRLRAATRPQHRLAFVLSPPRTPPFSSTVVPSRRYNVYRENKVVLAGCCPGSLRCSASTAPRLAAGETGPPSTRRPGSVRAGADLPVRAPGFASSLRRVPLPALRKSLAWDNHPAQPFSSPVGAVAAVSCLPLFTMEVTAQMNGLT